MILCCSFFRANSQVDFEVPYNVVLEAKEDYAKYEQDVIAAAKWLEETDLDKQKPKRKDINSFVLRWITGSPTVSMDLNEGIMKIYGENVQLLGIYIASYCRHFLENKDSATKMTGTRAGIISMMNVYKKKIDISRSKEMEKVIKAYDEGKLDDYISSKIK